jgi:hypothetical protein
MPKRRTVERALAAKRAGKAASTTPKRRLRVSRAVSKTLKKEPRSTASREALSRHVKAAARMRKRRTVSKTARKSEPQD